MHQVLRDGATFVGPATTRGTLYELYAHPVLVRTGNGLVHGEVYELTQPSRVLLDLDDHEGDGYTREIIEVTLTNGGDHEAWAYVWTGTLANATNLEGGNWLQR